MKVPDFVFLKGGAEKDWIPDHDTYISDHPTHYEKKNQEDWWYTNFVIRKAFLKIEQEIREAIDQGKFVSKKKVSWSKLAEICNIDRRTFKNPNRVKWTQLWKERMEKLINTPGQQKRTKDLQQEKIKSLESSLKNECNITAKYFSKTLFLEAKLKEAESVIGQYQKKIITLEQENFELKRILSR